ncbi:hypothetical protein CFBP6600_43050 [Xanthomonas arboricola pv. corylina]|uniref:Uncharacterized protein n=1 Tax=Xanthomonas arboricola pv. corylina TaxID=487821 RepID=A0A8D6VUL8_9XANT|nr:hypothetical protein CFBP1159_41250 [Xanthomonas arboricola pv. corylina]CAE6851496.1 hypothetical protein CFBP1159_41250 [Xanthomonas arboricola pv. corylina]CAE6858680.1 hypothetical protein XAC301_43350 [Xanthomonas arboricola pv. corylina]CAE6858696.1 hypothetical protein XAC301_43350 [Xanthomonas arboricola pv. corylina]CAE6859095.1 hypothetical protein CFBP6600_43050 [Xanthomonas arboricola pv. corylina]
MQLATLALPAGAAGTEVCCRMQGNKHERQRRGIAQDACTHSTHHVCGGGNDARNPLITAATASGASMCT